MYATTISKAKTPCLTTLVETAWVTGKKVKFKNFPGWDQWVVFWLRRHGNQSGMTWNFREVNWQIPGWSKKKSDWVTFKCQKVMWNISLVVQFNIRTIRWIMQIKIKFTQRYITIHLFRLNVRYDSLNVTRITSLLPFDMKNKQICKTINISRQSVSPHTIRDSNFESELEWRIQSVNSNSMEVWTRILDRLIFEMKLWKEIPGFTKIPTIIYQDKPLSRKNACPVFGGVLLKI